MGVPVQDFLSRRRNRAVGTILGWAEANLYKDLTQEQRDAFRLKVLEAANSYHDSVLDLVKAEDGVRNERVIELLEAMNSRLDHQVPTRVQVQSET